MKGNFNQIVMKNSVKVSLIVVFLAVMTGGALTFCSSKSDKPVDGQDTTQVEIDSAEVPVDSAAQEASDTTAAQ